MVNKYQYLLELKEFDKLINLGILSIHFMDWMQIYKYYLDELKLNDNKKMVCYLSTAEHFNYTDKQIQNIVKFMETII